MVITISQGKMPDSECICLCQRDHRDGSVIHFYQRANGTELCIGYDSWLFVRNGWVIKEISSTNLIKLKYCLQINA